MKNVAKEEPKVEVKQNVIKQQPQVNLNINQQLQQKKEVIKQKPKITEYKDKERMIAALKNFGNVFDNEKITKEDYTEVLNYNETIKNCVINLSTLVKNPLDSAKSKIVIGKKKKT